MSESLTHTLNFGIGSFFSNVPLSAFSESPGSGPCPFYKVCQFYNSDKPYDDFSNILKTVTDKHAPIKPKNVGGNNPSFMTKELRKAIMERSRLRNKYLKYHSKEYFLNMKKMKNKCDSISRKSKIKYLKRSTEKSVSSSKQFCFFVNPISPGLFGPCILLGWAKMPPCHKSSLANAVIMKLGQLVDQVKWSLLVYSLP